MNKLITSCALALAIAGVPDKGNSAPILETNISLENTYFSKAEKTEKSKVESRREILGLKIYDVEGEFNNKIADTLNDVGLVIREIIPRNVYLKTSVDEIKIGVKGELNSIFDFRF